MKFPANLIEGTYVSRPNRFSAIVKIGKKEELVFLPNPGRMKELLIPGAQAMVYYAGHPGRKTKYNFALIRLGKIWVSLNSHLANNLFAEGITKGVLPEFAGMHIVKPEVSVGHSRLDFLLEGPEGQCYVEVKSATLVKNEHARFPDAPTTRGTRHLKELISLRKRTKSAVVFVVQRQDAKTLSANRDTDPDFADALLEAKKANVSILAYRCSVKPHGIAITDGVRTCVD